MKKSKTNTKSKTRSLIHFERGKREIRSLRRCIPSLSARRRNEVRRRRPSKAPIHCSTFGERRPMGNSTAIAAEYVFEQLHRGRNSEQMHPCTQACTKHRGMDQHTWTYTDGHTQFIHWLGHQIYAPFPGRKTLLSHRHSSPGFHSAIWCLAKASFVTDCVLKRLYDQNLCGAEEFEFLCGKKEWGGVCLTV